MTTMPVARSTLSWFNICMSLKLGPKKMALVIINFNSMHVNVRAIAPYRILRLLVPVLTT
jgi:hypothetical protein